MNSNRSNSIIITPLEEHEVATVQNLIKSSMSEFDQTTQVVSAIMRRVEKLYPTYSAEGTIFFVARDTLKGGEPIAGAGLGSLHGLPITEGVGELRDLVVSPEYRGLGLGTKLIQTCIEKSKTIGYKKLYLETTPQMNLAQKLFLRTGFRPITESNQPGNSEDIASYFILEDL